MRPLPRVALSALALWLAGCGGAAVAPASPAAPAVAATPIPQASATGAAPESSPAVPSDTLLAADLTDVRTGDHFNLGGFQGKQVIIEGMATW